MQIHLRYFCVLCGSGTGGGRNVFCPYCEFQTNKEAGLWCRQLEGIKVYSLFRWTRRSPEALSALSEKVKEVKSPILFGHFAKALISNVPLDVFRGKTIMPLPSSTGRSHSLQLAESIGRILSLPLDTNLTLTLNQRQPGLSRKERFRRELRLRDLSRNYRDVLFVDDVITTGATMNAALKAIKPSSRAFGVTLFTREL